MYIYPIPCTPSLFAPYIYLYLHKRSYIYIYIYTIIY